MGGQLTETAAEDVEVPEDLRGGKTSFKTKQRRGAFWETESELHLSSTSPY